MQPANILQRNFDLERTLDELARSRIEDMRQKWSQLFSAPPPVAFGPDLLRRSISQKLQEGAYGGLDRATERLLNQLMAQSTKSDGKIVVPRRIKPGAVLVRDWKGKSHRITVLAEGFAFESKSYGSLSEIARMITGTRWNGPRFFGLRTDKE
jgi:hypothetical protein